MKIDDEIKRIINPENYHYFIINLKTVVISSLRNIYDQDILTKTNFSYSFVWLLKVVLYCAERRSIADV
jgi:hypothetical protein